MAGSYRLKGGGGDIHIIGTRGETVIHQHALHAALLDELAADPMTAGLALPPEFEIAPTWDGHLAVQIGTVELVDNSQTIRDAWNPSVPTVVRPAELHDVVELARMAIRRAAQRSRRTPPPAWKVLMHPVALALCLGHEPDRTRYPYSIRSDSGPRSFIWDVGTDGTPEHPGRHFTAAADCWLNDDNALLVRRLGIIAPRTTSALTFRGIGLREACTLSIPGAIPEVLKDGLVGRTLGELFELPHTGLPDVDAAAARCRISGVGELANGLDLSFAPADLIPYGVAPQGVDPRAMTLAPPRM